MEYNKIRRNCLLCKSKRQMDDVRVAGWRMGGVRMVGWMAGRTDERAWAARLGQNMNMVIVHGSPTLGKYLLAWECTYSATHSSSLSFCIFLHVFLSRKGPAGGALQNCAELDFPLAANCSSVLGLVGPAVALCVQRSTDGVNRIPRPTAN